MKTNKSSQIVRTRVVSPRNFEAIANETGLAIEEVERKYFDALARGGYRPGAKVYILLDKLAAIYKEKQ